MAEESLHGQVAIVTGAGRGIGAAIAEALAQAGCRLVLAARSREQLEAVAQTLAGQFGVDVLVVPTDISDEGQARALIETAVERFGRVDILVNNAGMGIYGAVDEIRLEDLRHVFDVNFFGALAAMQAAVPVMRRQGGGTVVNVGSIVGKFPQPLAGGYVATKFALHGASGAARAELMRENIRVVLVCPGLTETEFSQHSRVSIPGVEHAEGEKHAPMRGIDPGRVGARTVQAIKRGEREVYITWWDWLLVRFATLFPGLFQWLLGFVAAFRRQRFESHRRGRPAADASAPEEPRAQNRALALGWRVFALAGAGLVLVLWRTQQK